MVRTIHFRIVVRIYFYKRSLKDKLQPSETPKSNFVHLVDVSSSMDNNELLPLLKSGLEELLVKPNPDDLLSLITYLDDVKKMLLI